MLEVLDVELCTMYRPPNRKEPRMPNSGFHSGEDDQRDGQPAAVAEAASFVQAPPA